MEIHRTQSEGWLTNAYLVENGRVGLLVDGNGAGEELLRIARQKRVEILAVLVTHHHVDHVMFEHYAGLDVPYLAHELTSSELAEGLITQTIVDGEDLLFDDIGVEALHTPGHAHGHLAFRINSDDLITADLLFKGTVGGTRGPQATSLADLTASLRRVASFSPDMRLHPGHREPTTLADELRENVFLNALLSNEPALGEPCEVGGESATLLLWGPDYDGTNKAWVRLADGVEHITGGSQVRRRL